VRNGPTRRAKDHFDGITRDVPWFVGGWIQSAYLYDDAGDRTAALERFRIAESIAPRHMQVEQARERFFPRARQAQKNRAREFLDLARQHFGLDQEIPSGKEPMS
jgi:Tfp pilus assembly protein PilF